MKLPPTQNHLEIEDIIDDLVLLKAGGAAMVMETSAVNFGLLSETEQDATIFAYAGLLNSLSFPLQIVIRSKKMDISGYLGLLQKEEESQTNPNLATQIGKYRQFIESVTKQNRVLDKKFYLVIPFSPLELGVGSSAANLFGKKAFSLPKVYVLEKAKTILIPRRDHLIRQLSRIGLRAKQLTTQDLLSLFFSIYNPSVPGSQKAVSSPRDYGTFMVGPAVEGEKPVSREEKPLEEPPFSEKETPAETREQTPSAIDNDNLSDYIQEVNTPEEPAVTDKTPDNQASPLPESAVPEKADIAVPETVPDTKTDNNKGVLI